VTRLPFSIAFTDYYLFVFNSRFALCSENGVTDEYRRSTALIVRIIEAIGIASYRFGCVLEHIVGGFKLSKGLL
jgi:hypothetical protein